MAVPHPSRSGGHFAGLVSGGGGLLPTPRQVVTATAALPVDTRTLSRKVTFLTLSLNRQHFVIPFDRLYIITIFKFLLCCKRRVCSPRSGKLCVRLLTDPVCLFRPR